MSNEFTFSIHESNLNDMFDGLKEAIIQKVMKMEIKDVNSDYFEADTAYIDEFSYDGLTLEFDDSMSIIKVHIQEAFVRFKLFQFTLKIKSSGAIATGEMTPEARIKNIDIEIKIDTDNECELILEPGKPKIGEIDINANYEILSKIIGSVVELADKRVVDIEHKAEQYLMKEVPNKMQPIMINTIQKILPKLQTFKDASYNIDVGICYQKVMFQDKTLIIDVEIVWNSQKNAAVYVHNFKENKKNDTDILIAFIIFCSIIIAIFCMGIIVGKFCCCCCCKRRKNRIKRKKYNLKTKKIELVTKR